MSSYRYNWALTFAFLTLSSVVVCFLLMATDNNTLIYVYRTQKVQLVVIRIQIIVICASVLSAICVTIFIVRHFRCLWCLPKPDRYVDSN